MEELKINETPVRTSRNFNINNIKLKNVNIPQNISEFNNLKIDNEFNIEINSEVSDYKLTYGLGNVLINQVKEVSNKKLKVILNGINNKLNLNFKFDKDNLNLVEDIEIVANKGSRANIIIKYESEENIEAYHNGVIKIIAEENSNINITFINLLNTKSNNFISIENVIQENAKVNFYIIDFGGTSSITNYYSNLLGNSSKNNLKTIYLGKENQLFDLNYIGELRGEKSEIDIEVEGALKDNSKKHFKGTIDFKKGCKKAKGNENESCMLLSDKAKSLALPMLLCQEEDIEGNHSTSAGKIGEKELFYIMSRGFELKEAMKLMVRAKFNKIIDNIKDENLKEQILEEIDKRLD